MRKPHVPNRLAPAQPTRPSKTAARPQARPAPAKTANARVAGKVTQLPRRKPRLNALAGRSRSGVFRGSPLRRGVTFSAVGSVLVLISLVLASMFTPMMAIQEIKISGTHRLSAASIKNTVLNLMGTSLALVNESQIADRLKGFALIESFTTVSLPPHTLEIVIAERQPIGVVTLGGTDYLYDPAGVQVGLAKPSDQYPQVITEGDPRRSSQYRAAIDVLLALPMKLLPRVASIQATSKDDVRLRLRGSSSQQILWGDSSQSVLKAKVLAALIANTRKSASVTFDVSSPSTPTVRY